ncbi:MAG TPA: glycosyltransferase family 39 protein, partial [Thermoanaerobaculia bacterium]|nr:glycosyltransferase family 39 protein [Thermoanaerobaculia bacterium]
MRDAATTAPWLVRHAGVLVAVAFLAHGLATLADGGITWDEGESYRAGAQNLRLIAAAFSGRPLPQWPWHELPGYQFAADTLRAGFAAVVNRIVWEPGHYLGFHLANLLLATLAVALVARLAAREGGAPVLAPLAATLLVVQPKLVAHSQANPKDVVALVTWSAVVLALARAARTGRLGDFALLGAAAGAALASHVSALFIAPLALVWTLAAGSRPWRRRLAGLLLAGGVAAVVALLLWPWLWPAPSPRVLDVVHRIREFDVPMRVLYLGRVYRPAELPWHYGWLSLAIATPVPLLLAALAGGVAACRRGAASRLCRLAALWLGLLLLADLAAPARYDGARHLLPALPALALLAASGVYAVGVALWSLGATARRFAMALGALFAASLVALALELAAIHPYADAYLNAPARRALGPEAQHRVELEYWRELQGGRRVARRARAVRRLRAGADGAARCGPVPCRPLRAGAARRLVRRDAPAVPDADDARGMVHAPRGPHRRHRAPAVHRAPTGLDTARHLPLGAAGSAAQRGPIGRDPSVRVASDAGLVVHGAGGDRLL